MADQNPIEHLIQLMSKLPGLGPRSARRAVLHLMKRRNQLMGPLAQALADAALNTKDCVECGNISHAAICPICADPKRDTGEICVVSDVADLWAMERGGAFKGRYHVLGGTLSALDGVTPEDLRIPHLLARVAGTQSSHGAREVILALAATVDGQTTAHYIADTLRDRCKVSSLAQGVPVGGQLDYLDDGTIQAALRARKNYG